MNRIKWQRKALKQVRKIKGKAAWARPLEIIYIEEVRMRNESTY